MLTVCQSNCNGQIFKMLNSGENLTHLRKLILTTKERMRERKEFQCNEQNRNTQFKSVVLAKWIG